MDNTKIKIVIVDEHTIGFIYPEIPNFVAPLHTSILRGSPYSDSSRIYVPTSKIRLANVKDFDDYRVCVDGYLKDNNYSFNRS